MNKDSTSEKKDYLTSKDAAEFSGYNSDYLARLCRSGKLQGKYLDGVWYIEKESLVSFFSGEIYFEGKKFLSSRRAAELTGYSNDYLARLCRSGKLSGKIVGKSWYIAESSLPHFLFENTLQKKQQNQELSERRKDEYGSQFLSSESPISPAAFRSRRDIFKKITALSIAVLVVFGGYLLKDSQSFSAALPNIVRFATTLPSDIASVSDIAV